jgi:transcriptional regulator with XRE-family HTH domain
MNADMQHAEPDNPNNALNTIKRRLRERGITQAALAREWGVDPSQVTKFFQATRPYLPASRVPALAAATGWSAEEIMSLLNYIPLPPAMRLQSRRRTLAEQDFYMSRDFQMSRAVPIIRRYEVNLIATPPKVWVVDESGGLCMINHDGAEGKAVVKTARASSHAYYAAEIAKLEAAEARRAV